MTATAGDPAATRETDYTAVMRTLEIDANAARGSVTILITPVADNKHDGDGKASNEKISIKEAEEVKIGDKKVEIDAATITLLDKPKPKDPEPTAEEQVAELASIFSDDDVADADDPITGTVDEALDDKKLPTTEEDEDGELTYTLPGLPAGLAFDDASRTLSGTPTEAGETEVTYFVIEDGDIAGSLTYTIAIEAVEEPEILLEGIASTHTSVRENGGEATITLTVTLEDAAGAGGEDVSLAIVTPTEGKAAKRDVDFDATLEGSITIAEDATSGTTTLTLTPKDNTTADGHKAFGVQATSSSGHAAQVDIGISDNESDSQGIALSVDPDEVSEGTETAVTVTASLDGKASEDDVTVAISISSSSSATRDVDYSAVFDDGAEVTIAAGDISGTATVTITAVADDDGDETIIIVGSADDLGMGSAAITLVEGMMDDDMEDGDMADDDMEDGDMADDMEDDDMMAGLHFDGEVADQAYTAGTAIADLVLPEAKGGTGAVTYRVFGLPAGLAFDDSTRTISGTPEAAGTAEVTALAEDEGGTAATLSFNITVNAALSFGDLFGAAAGKANPASDHDDGVISIVVGQELVLPLPEVTGGTPPLSYTVSGLPAGLSFDPETRTVSGAPEALTAEPVLVTYLVTDATGASKGLPILVSVVEPPLGAPANLVAEDYNGADGAGDQGGFILLTWELSEHHGSIDGYRIFRALPVLGNELVPWAMVDAVPGVETGRAIIATLDNVSTRWGIASERNGQTTFSGAKAAFVSAESIDQPYAQMAETLMASKAAAGDAPVFGSLLPEALAYAQGVTPRLNVVEGVLSHSEIIVTDEPVRAIDNIAPLAVPSLSVLDAPNDEGSRILLTWTLSPSDQLLEDVVGVYGYNIYRKTGEGEFAKVGQVDAGVASFVDETALNGVRYTYQVRPYDLDNETVSDAEQTAMAVRNIALDSEGRTLLGLFGTDNSIGFDDFFIFADSFGLTAEDAGFDPAFDLAPNAMIDFDDFFVFADNFGRNTAAAGKRVPMLAGLNADARMYLDARTAMPVVGEDFVLDVRVADFAAIKGYGLQVQYDVRASWSLSRC